MLDLKFLFDAGPLAFFQCGSIRQMMARGHDRLRRNLGDTDLQGCTHNFLKKGDHLKEISRLRIPLRAEHTH
jgi:hypothetical protein